MTLGKCKLTGHTGKYVKSHIIPQVYTKPERAGAPLIQSGESGRPIRRWTSWYDTGIVTQKGETLLGSYDNDGLNELVRHKLVWHSWGPMQSLSTTDIKASMGPSHGFRSITDLNSKHLRMFFLSMLWRSAVSTLKEMSAIQVSPGEEAQLRQMLLGNDDGNPGFFPITLTQLSTIGRKHNHTPILQTKKIPSIKDDRLDFENPKKHVSFFRFYLDGLIVHIHRDHDSSDIGPTFIGCKPELIVSTITYEASFQKEIIDHIIYTAYTSSPATMSSLLD